MSVYGCCIYVFSVLSMLSEVYGVIIVCISFVFPCDVSLSWHVIVWVCHVCVWMCMYGSCPDDGMCLSICVYDVLNIAYEYNVCHVCICCASMCLWVSLCLWSFMSMPGV